MVKRSRLKPVPRDFTGVADEIIIDVEVPLQVEEVTDEDRRPTYKGFNKSHILAQIENILSGEIQFIAEVSGREELDNPIRINIDIFKTYIRDSIRSLYEEGFEEEVKESFGYLFDNFSPDLQNKDDYKFFIYLERILQQRIDELYAQQCSDFNEIFEDNILFPETLQESHVESLNKSKEYSVLFEALKEFEGLKNLAPFGQYNLCFLIEKLLSAINACRVFEEDFADPALSDYIARKYAKLTNAFLKKLNTVLKRQCLDINSDNSLLAAQQFILDFSNDIICVNLENAVDIEKDLIEALKTVDTVIKSKLSPERYEPMKGQLQKNEENIKKLLVDKLAKAKNHFLTTKESKKFLQDLKSKKILLTPENRSRINNKVAESLQILHQNEINLLGRNITAESLLVLYFKYQREMQLISNFLRKYSISS